MSKLEDIEKVVRTDNCVDDIRLIIEQGRQAAYSSVNLAMINTYWNVGRRIVEEEQNGAQRAEYGKAVLKNLAEHLIPLYGESYSERNLSYYRKFYIDFQDIGIVNACVHNLKWTHFRSLLRVQEEDFCCVPRPVQTLPATLYYTTTTIFSWRNTCLSCLRKNSSVPKLKSRRRFFICNTPN